MGRRPNSGFTLSEMLITIVVIGGLMLLALPKFQDAVRRSDVRGARTKVVTLYNQAKAVAMTTNRWTALRLNGNSAMITTALPGGGLDTLGGIEDLYGQYGVTMSSTDTMLSIDPRGFGSGAGTAVSTISLVRGSHADTVQISGFGRVVAK